MSSLSASGRFPRPGDKGEADSDSSGDDEDVRAFDFGGGVDDGDDDDEVPPLAYVFDAGDRQGEVMRATAERFQTFGTGDGLYGTAAIAAASAGLHAPVDTDALAASLEAQMQQMQIAPFESFPIDVVVQFFAGDGAALTYRFETDVTTALPAVLRPYYMDPNAPPLRLRWVITDGGDDVARPAADSATASTSAAAAAAGAAAAADQPHRGTAESVVRASFPGVLVGGTSTTPPTAPSEVPQLPNAVPAQGRVCVILMIRSNNPVFVGFHTERFDFSPAAAAATPAAAAAAAAMDGSVEIAAMHASGKRIAWREAYTDAPPPTKRSRTTDEGDAASTTRTSPPPPPTASPEPLMPRDEHFRLRRTTTADVWNSFEGQTDTVLSVMRDKRTGAITCVHLALALQKPAVSAELRSIAARPEAFYRAEEEAAAAAVAAAAAGDDELS